MSNERVTFIAELYEGTYKSTAGVIANVAEDHRLRQTQDGKAHPLWLVGHLSMTNNLLIGNWILGNDLTIPAEWTQIFAPDFAGGKPITGSAQDYPGWDEVASAYKSTGKAVVESIRGLADDQLAGDALGPMPDQFKETFGKLGVGLTGMALHDSHHRGQLALLAGLD